MRELPQFLCCDNENCQYDPLKGSPLKPYLALMLQCMHDTLLPFQMLNNGVYRLVFEKLIKPSIWVGDQYQAGVWKIAAVLYQYLFCELMGYSHYTRYMHSIVNGGEYWLRLAHKLHGTQRGLHGGDQFEQLNDHVKALVKRASMNFLNKLTMWHVMRAEHQAKFAVREHETKTNMKTRQAANKKKQRVKDLRHLATSDKHRSRLNAALKKESEYDFPSPINQTQEMGLWPTIADSIRGLAESDEESVQPHSDEDEEKRKCETLDETSTPNETVTTPHYEISDDDDMSYDGDMYEEVALDRLDFEEELYTHPTNRYRTFKFIKFECPVEQTTRELHIPQYTSITLQRAQMLIHYPVKVNNTKKIHKVYYSLQHLYRYFAHKRDDHTVLNLAFIQPPTILLDKDVLPDPPSSLRALQRSSILRIGICRYAATDGARNFIRRFTANSNVTEDHECSSLDEFNKIPNIFDDSKREEINNMLLTVRHPFMCKHSILAQRIKKQLNKMCSGTGRICTQCRKTFGWFTEHAMCLQPDDSVDTCSSLIPNLLMQEGASVHDVEDPTNCNAGAADLITHNPRLWSTFTMKLYQRAAGWLLHIKLDDFLRCRQRNDWKLLGIPANVFGSMIEDVMKGIMEQQEPHDEGDDEDEEQQQNLLERAMLIAAQMFAIETHTVDWRRLANGEELDDIQVFFKAVYQRGKMMTDDEFIRFWCMYGHRYSYFEFAIFK